MQVLKMDEITWYQEPCLFKNTCHRRRIFAFPPSIVLQTSDWRRRKPSTSPIVAQNPLEPESVPSCHIHTKTSVPWRGWRWDTDVHVRRRYRTVLGSLFTPSCLFSLCLWNTAVLANKHFVFLLRSPWWFARGPATESGETKRCFSSDFTGCLALSTPSSL